MASMISCLCVDEAVDVFQHQRSVVWIWRPPVRSHARARCDTTTLDIQGYQLSLHAVVWQWFSLAPCRTGP